MTGFYGWPHDPANWVAFCAGLGAFLIPLVFFTGWLLIETAAERRHFRQWEDEVRKAKTP